MRTRQDCKNRLLASLDEEDFAALLPLLQPVSLPLRKMLQTRDRRIEQVYFLEGGIASMVASAGTEYIDVGMIGREGMTGLSLVMGVDTSPCDTFMQAPGHGWSLSRDALMHAMARSTGLRNTLLLYGHTMILQMAFTALANGKYSISERLARWLLMAQDCGNPGPMHLTHESLAQMLGVRRPGVTACLNVLERSGLIATARGSITIVDRAGLREASNGCYGIPEAEFNRLFAPEPSAMALAS